MYVWYFLPLLYACTMLWLCLNGLQNSMCPKFAFILSSCIINPCYSCSNIYGTLIENYTYYQKDLRYANCKP